MECLKKILVVMTCVFATVGSLRAQETYTNPIINRSLPDPTVLRDADGTYWLYATEDIHNTPIYRSTIGRLGVHGYGFHRQQPS